MPIGIGMRLKAMRRVAKNQRGFTPPGMQLAAGVGVKRRFPSRRGRKR